MFNPIQFEKTIKLRQHEGIAWNLVFFTVHYTSLHIRLLIVDGHFLNIFGITIWE